jgi:hypothetical protein
MCVTSQTPLETIRLSIIRENDMEYDILGRSNNERTLMGDIIDQQSFEYRQLLNLMSMGR